jgi:hypothetical protein
MAAAPPAERRAALASIARQALSIDAEALLREAFIRLIGGSCFTQPQRLAMQQALEQLLITAMIHLRDGRMFPGKSC